jgi:hypothetical protein
MFGSITIALGLCLGCLGLGLRLLKILRISISSSFGKLAIAFALGFGISGNLYMLLGALGLYKNAILWLTLFLFLLFSVTEIAAIAFLIRNILKNICLEVKQNKIWSFAGFLFLIVYIFRGFLPPTGLDALMYHLSIPQLYLNHHGFINVFFHTQANYIMLTEMNYVPILATGNATGCGFLSLIIGLFLTGGIALIGKEFLHKSIALPGAILFLSLTNTMANFSSCDVDFTMALYALLAFWVAIKPVKDRKEVVLIILLLGFCTQIKVFGFFNVLSIGAACLLLHKNSGKAIMAIILISLLFSIPYIAKAWHYHQNFTDAVIQTSGIGQLQDLSPQISAFSRFGNMVFDFLRRVIIAPWSFSLMPNLHRMDTFGPLFLILLPGLFFIKEKNKVKPFLIFSFAYILLMSLFETVTFKGGASIRYSVPVLAFFCPLAVYAWQEGFTKWKWAYRTIQILIFVTISINLVICFKRYRHDLLAVIKRQPQQEYLLQNLTEYPTIDYANRHLSEKDTIMTSNGFGLYYLKIPYFSVYRNYATGNEMISDFKRLGVRYLLANNILDTASNQKEWAAESSRLLVEKNSVRLYELKTTGLQN